MYYNILYDDRFLSDIILSLIAVQKNK
jgi:hypothetical protein